MISLNVILHRLSRAGREKKPAKRMVKGSPQSRASLNTLVKIILILGDNGLSSRARDSCCPTDRRSHCCRSTGRTRCRRKERQTNSSRRSRHR